MPLALALVAGALASVNPCGFPLLPAFLSFYVGAEEAALPRAPAGVAQGLLVGLLVAAGFLAVFEVVGIPIAYGVTQLTSAIPWAGLGIEILMIVAALAGTVLVARSLSLSLRRTAPVRTFGMTGTQLASVAVIAFVLTRLLVRARRGSRATRLEHWKSPKRVSAAASAALDRARLVTAASRSRRRQCPSQWNRSRV